MRLFVLVKQDKATASDPGTMGAVLKSLPRAMLQLQPCPASDESWLLLERRKILKNTLATISRFSTNNNRSDRNVACCRPAATLSLSLRSRELEGRQATSIRSFLFGEKVRSSGVLVPLRSLLHIDGPVVPMDSRRSLWSQQRRRCVPLRERSGIRSTAS